MTVSATDGPDASRGGAGDRPPLRIVVAEDESIIRLDLVEILGDEGYEVVGSTGRGDEAMEMVRSLRPDLVILDIKMPGIDGLEVARMITAERMAAVLILTAFSQRDLVTRATDAGALAYLVKPFEQRDLVPAIEIAHARHLENLALADQAADLADRLAARKLIDRAKGRLMDEHDLSEHDAFRFIQTRAMSERTTMGAVAAALLEGWAKADDDAGG